jgi:uncharacterized phiE125 gp8 family phage protein
VADLVTSAETKRFLNVTHTDDDTLIGELITAVSAGVGRYTGRAFTPATSYTEYLTGGSENLIVRRPPIKAITGVYDHFDDDDEVDDGDYEFNAEAGLIYFTQDAVQSVLSDSSGVWAAGYRRWKVTYTVDYSAVPADVKLAAMTWIADIYEHRDDLKSGGLGDMNFLRAGAVSVQDMPDRAKTILDRYRLAGI